MQNHDEQITVCAYPSYTTWGTHEKVHMKHVYGRTWKKIRDRNHPISANAIGNNMFYFSDSVFCVVPGRALEFGHYNYY